MAKEPEKSQTPRPAAPAQSPAAPAQSPKAAAQALRRPPQGGVVDVKPFTYGAPPRHVKYNIATRVLADPVARTRFSQPYSGQRRLWPG